MEDLDLKQLDQAFRQQIHHCQELLKAEKSQGLLHYAHTFMELCV